jgi:hypothetical protein
MHTKHHGYRVQRLQALTAWQSLAEFASPEHSPESVVGAETMLVADARRWRLKSLKRHTAGKGGAACRRDGTLRPTRGDSLLPCRGCLEVQRLHGGLGDLQQRR